MNEKEEGQSIYSRQDFCDAILLYGVGITPLPSKWGKGSNRCSTVLAIKLQ